MRRTLPLAILLASLACSTSYGQEDPLQEANRLLKKSSGDKLYFTFEERTRWEEKDGVSFGKAVDQQDMLSRLRIGFGYNPTEWLSLYAMGQDARAPFYGANAPTTLRDPMALQEAWVKLFDRREAGFGASLGREMLDYGESRVIGTPQWTNTARTYDHTRLYYRTAKARYEILMVSPVKILENSFNVPDLGERIWGTYEIVPKLWHGASIDAYALRHSQNRIGGFTGAGTLGTDSFGGRFYGPLPAGLDYSLEGIGQTGHIGYATERAYAWYSRLAEQFHAGAVPVRLSIEYKGASGTRAGSETSGTYDQLSPANHDNFGHEDLFGWRNLKTVKSLDTIGIRKALALNFMYTDEWLYSASDALYNSSGSSIAVSKTGTAGTHVGQEFDSFLTWKHKGHTLGAGFGHFFKGEFIDITTPHVNPRYFYVFQQYSLR